MTLSARLILTDLLFYFSRSCAVSYLGTYLLIFNFCSRKLHGKIMFQTFQNWMRGSTDGSRNRKKLDGRVAAITGATSGIGKAVAEDLGPNHLLL